MTDKSAKPPLSKTSVSHFGRPRHCGLVQFHLNQAAQAGPFTAKPAMKKQG